MTATECTICKHALSAPPQKGPAGVPVCSRCHGCRVTVRTAGSERTPGDTRVRTFYVTPFRRGTGTREWSIEMNASRTSEYVVKRIGRVRMTCTCPDYVHRAQVENDVCKHIRLVKLLIRVAGGIARIEAGISIPFRIAQPERRH